MSREDTTWQQAGDGPLGLDGVEDLNVVLVGTER